MSAVFQSHHGNPMPCAIMASGCDRYIVCPYCFAFFLYWENDLRDPMRKHPDYCEKRPEGDS